ncbi:DEAD/DEAH box helicase [Geothrix sp.]|jgi:ATP-dependent RNA helicase RhlE|uniref:DEAD/DEAH box helicase n=1 Tax=Geothrix sp. TaxID=1962974 RepID=UPI0025B98446|nr:DEAD/DEAH box helicase [Geothrix sp.]
MSFDTLGLMPELLRAVREQGYEHPTPIQVQAIPLVLEGRDLMGRAQTGTGKTAGFTLPMLQRLAHHANTSASPARHPIRALILTPTRELAMQVEESVRTYGKYIPLRSTTIFGGVNINPQTKALRAGVEILVATPGRLLDHQGQGNLNFSQLEVLVLDEADRMLDMGFIRDIQKILALLPTSRQTLLFSATFTDEIKQLASKFLKNPASVQITPQNTAAELVRQVVHPVDRERKRALLAHLITSRKLEQVLVFTRTKHGANRLSEQLDKDGISSMAIHGNKSQPQRIKALEDFKKGAVRVLVATDIAARGLDIDSLPHVVNYELPQVPEDYIHRIGRTGRAGAEGEALSLVCVDEHKLLKDIEKLLRKELPRDVVHGYAPDPSIPAEPILTGRQGGGGGRSRGPARPRTAAAPAPRGERGRHPSRPGARGK